MRLVDLNRLADSRQAELPPVPSSARAEPLFAARTVGILADAQSQGGRLRGRAMELAFSDPNALRAVLRQAYPDADRFDLQRLELRAAQGELPLPERVRFVDRDALEGASAAYEPRDGGEVLIAADLRDAPELLARAYAEEAGHHLDRWLGGGDSQGDEGAIFARGLLERAPLAGPDLAAERADRDRGLPVLGERAVRVEFWDKDYAGGAYHGERPGAGSSDRDDPGVGDYGHADGSGSDGASGGRSTDHGEDGIGDARDGLDDDDRGFHMGINPEGPVSGAGQAWDAALDAVDVEDYGTPEEKAEALKGAYNRAVDDQREDGADGEDATEAPRLDVSATNRDELRAYFQGRLDYLDDNRPGEALAEDVRAWEEDRALTAAVVEALNSGALPAGTRRDIILAAAEPGPPRALGPLGWVGVAIDLFVGFLEYQHAQAVQHKIDELLANPDNNIQWQGRVTELLRNAGVPIEAIEETVVDPATGNVLGRPDLETNQYVIEMTIGTGKHKVSQFVDVRTALDSLADTRDMVVYGPNLSLGVTRELERRGAIVVKDERELISRLGGDPRRVGYL